MATQGYWNMLEVYNDSTVIHICSYAIVGFILTVNKHDVSQTGLDSIFRRKIRLIPIQFDQTGKAHGYSRSQSLG
jgi:hypothetical protein